MKEKTYFSTIGFQFFFPTYRIVKKLVQICIGLILGTCHELAGEGGGMGVEIFSEAVRIK